MSEFVLKLPVSVGYKSTSQGFYYPFHSHHKYEIFYFHAGKCNYLIGDKIYVMQPGDLIIMHGMTLHRPNVDPKEEYVRSIIHFEPSYIQSLFDFPHAINTLKPFQELSNYRIHLGPSQQQEIELFFQKLLEYRNLQSQVGHNRFVLSLMDLMVFIYSVFETKLFEHVDYPSEKVKHVQNMISFIENNYQNDFHLHHLEEYFHLNRFYLSKIFKEVTGTTIFTYLLQRRINQAKILFLTEGNLSVTEVCYQVGFKHPAHFSRVFKQQVAQTAEQYKKSKAMNTNES